KAQRQRRTAETLRNYQLAIEALQNLESPNALALARKSASGITRTHALPLNALYKAQLARASASPKRARSSDAGKVFSLNMTQEADRAWISYVERGAQLLAAGQPAEARRVAEE